MRQAATTPAKLRRNKWNSRGNHEAGSQLTGHRIPLGSQWPSNPPPTVLQQTLDQHPDSRPKTDHPRTVKTRLHPALVDILPDMSMDTSITLLRTGYTPQCPHADLTWCSTHSAHVAPHNLTYQNTLPHCPRFRSLRTDLRASLTKL